MARIPGLDVSVWDKGIDLAEWKRKHGIGFVIIKCGGNEGGRYADRCLSEHYDKARAAGLPVGFYYYTTSTTVADARADADHCIDLLRGCETELPIFMDVEDNRQFALSKRALTDVIKAFCDRIQEHPGLRAGLYTGGNAWCENMYADELRQYCTWIASWQAEWPSWVGKIDAWQEGSIDFAGNHYHKGIDVDRLGHVDFDWVEDYVIQGGGKVPIAKTGWAETLEQCQDPADYAYCTCKVYSCGYSQPKRKNISIEHLKAGTAETDCSAGVSWWLFMGGYLDECPWFYTAIEREYLQEHGFELIDANAGFVKMQRNDVLWRPGHTALYIGDGMQAEALRTERHDAGYDGSTPGDQDGGETVVRKLTLDWDYILRKREQPTYDTDTTPTEVSESMAILYDGGDNKVYYWTGDPESVPYHVSGAEKAALEKVYGLELKKLDKGTADTIMSMCKARKAWREQGIASATKE